MYLSLITNYYMLCIAVHYYYSAVAMHVVTIHASWSSTRPVKTMHQYAIATVQSIYDLTHVWHFGVVPRNFSCGKSKSFVRDWSLLCRGTRHYHAWIKRLPCHDIAISDAPIPILASVSALFWRYRTCIGNAINAQYLPIL